jgi:hypothetical protein
VKPSQDDSCKAMETLCAVYSVLQAAALWYGIKEDNIDEILINAEAIESGKLPHRRRS